MHLANSNLLIVFAYLLANFEITKATNEDGSAIEPSITMRKDLNRCSYSLLFQWVGTNMYASSRPDALRCGFLPQNRVALEELASRQSTWSVWHINNRMIVKSRLLCVAELLCLRWSKVDPDSDLPWQLCVVALLRIQAPACVITNPPFTNKCTCPNIVDVLWIPIWSEVNGYYYRRAMGLGFLNNPERYQALD